MGVSPSRRRRPRCVDAGAASRPRRVRTWSHAFPAVVERGRPAHRRRLGCGLRRKGALSLRVGGSRRRSSSRRHRTRTSVRGRSARRGRGDPPTLRRGQSLPGRQLTRRESGGLGRRAGGGSRAHGGSRLGSGGLRGQGPHALRPEQPPCCRGRDHLAAGADERSRCHGTRATADARGGLCRPVGIGSSRPRRSGGEHPSRPGRSASAAASVRRTGRTSLSGPEARARVTRVRCPCGVQPGVARGESGDARVG